MAAAVGSFFVFIFIFSEVQWVDIIKKRATNKQECSVQIKQEFVYVKGEVTFLGVPFQLGWIVFFTIGPRCFQPLIESRSTNTIVQMIRFNQDSDAIRIQST